MQNEPRHPWQILVRSAALTLAAWALADGALDNDFVRDGARPARRAAPGPRPLPFPAQPVIVPRTAAELPEPEARRTDSSPTAMTTRPPEETRLPPPCEAGRRNVRHERTPRLLLLVAPKHGPPALA